MRTGMSLLAAAATGALATYLLDEQQGARRRAVLRDKLNSNLNRLNEMRRVAAIDLRNRGQGTLAALRSRARHEDVPDDVLAERVRARLGRVASHPGALEVTVSGGTLTLQGPVLAHELERVVRAARRVPGVRDVVDRLEAHKQQGDVPGLQGGRPREQRIDILQEHWAPATRVLAGGAGAGLAAYGLARRSPMALILGLAGTALLVRAATNMDMPRLLGQRGRAGVGFIKTIHIPAPASAVYAFWSNPENFPKFMRNVRAVRRNRDGAGWHWEVAGLLGIPVHWDAEITAQVPEELIAWATTDGSPVQHAGVVRFQPDGEGTRVQVEMGYNPPAGPLGHVVAALFGADPEAEMNADLMRLKSFFETGKPARDAAAARV